MDPESVGNLVRGQIRVLALAGASPEQSEDAKPSAHIADNPRRPWHQGVQDLFKFVMGNLAVATGRPYAIPEKGCQF